MNCPNCGKLIDPQSKFCAICGHVMSLPPAWGQTGPQGPAYGTSSGPLPAVPYGAPAGGLPAGGLAGALALIGGAIAIGSVWLPWSVLAGRPMLYDAWTKPIAITDSAFGLTNGNYLLAAGATAAIFGLLLFLGIANTSMLRLVLAIGAIGGAIGIGVVEFSAYSRVSDAINGANGPVIDVGWGLYVGIAGAVLAAAGGLLAVASTAPTAVGPSAPVTGRIVGVGLVLAIGAGLIIAMPQISKQIDGSNGPTTIFNQSPSPSAAATPTVAITETPSDAPSDAPTAPPTEKPAAPTPAASFLTKGYATPELALQQFFEDNGLTYGGDCATSPTTARYCTSFVAKTSTGRAYGAGAPASEAEGWILVVQSDGKWYVADYTSAANGSPPPWK